MTENNGGSLDTEKLLEMENRIRQRHRLLEEENGRLKARLRIVGIGLVVALVLNLATIFLPGVTGLPSRVHSSGTLRIHHVVLQDASGNRRGEWQVDGEGNARLTLLDRQSNPRLSLSVLSGGSPGMSLIDATGQRRVGLAFLPDESAYLTLADRSGVSRAVLGLEPSGATSLTFADGNASLRAALGLDPEGAGVLMIPEEVPGASEEQGGGGGS